MPTSSDSTFVRDIVVIGASAGGIPAVSELLRELPPRFPASVFVVLHLGRDTPSVLGPLLDRVSALPVRTARDGDAIEPGVVYVAREDRHMTLEGDRVHVVVGPLQNRHRPSVDVLFRSAALTYGPRVIGVVLTGFLSDGALGLVAIKERGGVTVVEDPDTAAFPDMPKNALRAGKVDHCVPLAELPALLVRLASPMRTKAPPPKEPSAMQRFEVDADRGEVHDIGSMAKPSSFLCPDCGGALWELNNDGENGSELRYRCRVGHGYSGEALAVGQDAAVETALYAAARSLQDHAALYRRLAEAWRDREAPEVLQHFESKAEQSSAHAATIRAILGVSTDADSG